MSKTRGCTPVDLEISRRLKAKRLSLGMTQQELAGHLGLTFQQIQKYETGINRLSGGMLHKAAAALHVEPSYFFPPIDGDFDCEADAPALSRLGHELVRRFTNMDEHRQKSLVNVARALAPADELAAA